MKRSLLTVFRYFGYFSYPPSFNEIYTYYPQKIRRKDLRTLLIDELRSGNILQLPNSGSFRLSNQSIFDFNFRFEFPRYTLPQYSIGTHKKLKIKNQNRNNWTAKTIQKYISLLHLLPFVRFVGITGASAVVGVKENDDVDLCIASRQGLIWTTRFCVVVLAKILGIHHKTGVCLNLFFDESNLTIPPEKQNIYIGHEILQMKPVIDKDHVYRRFLSENEWIYRHFPNARIVIPANAGTQRKINDWIPASAGMTQRIDSLFQSIQLPIIRRNKTAFIITPSQLWLFKNDFEKKLKRSGLVI